MIALDTNVLVRFLVEDDASQSAAAAALVERAIEDDEPLFISHVVICETVWVLAGSYRVARPKIVSTLRELLRARALVIERGDELTRALESFANGRGDFADYVIRERARSEGCSRVATFDRTLLKEPGFSAP